MGTEPEGDRTTRRTSAGREAVAEELRGRILVLIPAHPEILGMDNPFKLFKIPEFECDDLRPTLEQADWALGQACREYKEARR